MKKPSQYRKTAAPGFLKLTLAAMAALSLAPLAHSQPAPEPADWSPTGENNSWILSEPLVGDSVSANSFGLGALEVISGLNASILPGGSWTGLELENPLVIAFQDYGELALGGDLSATTDYQDPRDAFLSGAVGFFNGGVLSGEGNITISSDSTTSVAPIVLAGVYSNDLVLGNVDDAIEGLDAFGEDGTLDITNYTGDITVTNDNSAGPAMVNQGESFPIPLPIPFEIDLSKSAVAVGIAAVESDNGLDLGSIYGPVTQNVTTTAISRNAEFVESGEDEGSRLALTAAVAAGVIGGLEDGIASTANIETTATSGTSVAQTDEEVAVALDLGLAIGMGGIVNDIEDGATITTTATSGTSLATSTGNSAYANNIALAAGIVGLVRDESGELLLGDEPAAPTTSITTTASSAASTANAEGFAEAASGALSVGMGGLLDGLSNSEFTTTATSSAVLAESDQSDALGLSVSAAVGAIGLVKGDLDNTAITSTATSGTTDVNGAFTAGATGLSLAGGIIGQIQPESADLALNATANAGATTAEAEFYAAADASALAFGVSGGETLYFLLEALGPIFGGEGLPLPDGLDLLAGDLLSGFVLPDSIESEEALIPSYPFSYTINGEIVANAADATAEQISGEVPPDALEGEPFRTAAYANASAVAVGFDTPVGFPEDLPRDAIEGDDPGSISSLDGTFSVTANAANANASSKGSAESLANAYALGFDEVNADVSADLTVTASAGTATSTYGYETPEPSYAEANANATGIDTLNGNLDAAGSVQVNASSESGSASGSAAAYANANAVATGIGSVENSSSINANLLGTIDVDAAAGDATADAFFDAEASAETYATGGITGGDHYGEIGGTITADAVGAVAEANSGEAAFASAYTEAVGVYVKPELAYGEGDDFNGPAASIEGDVTAAITANATADAATAISDGSLFNEVNDAIEGNGLLSTEVVADAAAVAIGIENVDTIFGDVSGPITANSAGGSAYAEALFDEQPLDSVETILNGEYSQSFATVADASSKSIGVDGSIDGSLSSTINLTAGATEGSVPMAEAYNDIGGYALADASAATTGVAGDVLGNALVEFDEPAPTLSGSFTQSATGGDAVAEVSSEFLFNPQPNSDAIESEDFEFFYTASASALADSFGVDGRVVGDVEADFVIDATGGRALASADLEVDSAEALAFADAAGIYGSVEGNFDGSMAVTATGGDAFIEDIGFIDFIDQTDAVENGEYLFENWNFADASATATGIGGESELAIDGNVAGTINVEATGGRVARIGGIGMGVPYNIDTIESVPVESFEGLYVREASYNAYAQAVGLNGDTYSETVSAAITASATGGQYSNGEGLIQVVNVEDPIEGEASMQIGSEYSVGAFAAGIAGQNVIIGEVTGDITAEATGGNVLVGFGGPTPNDVIEGDAGSPDFPTFPGGFPVDSGYAFAAGIMTYTPGFYSAPADAIEAIDVGPDNVMDITIASKITATADSLFVGIIEDAIESDGYSTLMNPYAYAAAVYGAQGDDLVQLAGGANIVGDINLGGGLNTLSVIGDTIMEGNILSTANSSVDFLLNIDNGIGTIDFDIDEGFFTPIRTVNVSDLTDTLTVEATGGIAPILNQSTEDFNNSRINVLFGNSELSVADVAFASGSTVLPVFDESVDLNTVVGNEYLLVSAAEGIVDGGALVDNTDMPFEYILEIRDQVFTDAIEGTQELPIGQDLFLVVDRVKDLDEEETPGTVQTNQAVNSSSQAVLVDISKRAALLRTLLRTRTQAPTGPSGPDTEKMSNGEWLSYISVFGNIGKQESSNGFAGFDYDTYGMTLGQEKLCGDQLILGIAGGYAETDIEGLDNSGGGDSELYSIVAYANWFTETWYVEGGLTYGHAESDVRRVDFKSDAYTGNYDSDLFGGWVEFGMTTEHEGFGLEPYIRATYIHGEHDGFTDKGPDALVLTTEDNETDNFKTELGLRVNRIWVLENDDSFKVEVKAAWQHEWGDDDITVDSSYLSDDSLTLQSAEADEDAIVLGLIGEWRNGEGLALSLEYEPTISGNWYNHAFSGTIQYNW